MSLGSFFLGAVAIFVATIVYAWQRSLDWRTDQKKELQRLYSEYLSACTRAYLSQPFKGEKNEKEKAEAFHSFNEEEQKFYCVGSELWLLAPTHIAKEVEALDKAFRDWKIAFTSEHRDLTETERLSNELLSQKGQLARLCRQDLELFQPNKPFSGINTSGRLSGD